MSNQEQGEFWNGRTGEGWVSVESYIDQMLAPISEEAVRRADPKEGERIIDIGCGCGTTTLQLAAGGAAVWGVDISELMIEKAKEKTGDAAEVRFSVADAAAQDYTPDHHCVFSRFGVMFFSDPVAAFQNIRSALKPDGRLVFLCWQAPVNNPWMALVGQTLQPFMPEDAPQPAPTDPGPFAFADPGYTSDILSKAGFAGVNIESVEKDMVLGEDLDQIMAFQSRVGPLSGLLATVDEETGEQAKQAVMNVLTSHLGERGVVLGAAAWLVTARQS